MKRRVCWVFAFFAFLLAAGNANAEVCEYINGMALIPEVNCAFFNGDDVTNRNDLLLNGATNFFSLETGDETALFKLLITREEELPINYSEIIDASITGTSGEDCSFNDVLKKVECPIGPNDFLTDNISRQIVIVEQYNYEYTDTAPNYAHWIIELREYIDIDGVFSSRFFKASFELVRPEVTIDSVIDGWVVVDPIKNLHGDIINVENASSYWVEIAIFRVGETIPIRTFPTDIILSGNRWDVDWDARGFDNGEYTIKAVGVGRNHSGLIVRGEENSVNVTVNLSDGGQFDTTPPTLTEEIPAANSIIQERMPLIIVKAEDPESGIDPDSIRMLVDGSEVTATYSIDDDLITYPFTDELGFGQHEINVTVSNNFDLVASKEWIFFIEEPPASVNPPNTDLSASPQNGEGPLDVTFTYNCEERGEEINSCILDFGDGNFIELLRSNYFLSLPHTFAPKDGAYTSILTATDGLGNTAEDSVEIYSTIPSVVSPPEIPPSADLSANIYSGEGPLYVNLSYKCESGSSPLETCRLEFGDGESI